MRCSIRLNESEWVSVSLRVCEWENSENRKILQHDRNRRYCREHSQKFHTNEKLHASERLWSESHFRLVSIRIDYRKQEVKQRFLKIYCSKVIFYLNIVKEGKWQKWKNIEHARYLFDIALSLQSLQRKLLT